MSLKLLWKIKWSNFVPFILKIEQWFDCGFNGRHRVERFLLSEDVKFSTDLWILFNWNKSDNYRTFFSRLNTYIVKFIKKMTWKYFYIYVLYRSSSENIAGNAIVGVNYDWFISFIFWIVFCYPFLLVYKLNTIWSKWFIQYISVYEKPTIIKI